MNNLYCPVCGGTLQAYLGPITVRVGLHQPSSSHVGQYAACHTCALVSEIDSRTQILIDLGDIKLVDCCAPQDEPASLIIGAVSRLEGVDS